MGCFLVQQGQIQRSGFYVSAESPKLRTARVAKVDFVRLWTWRRCSPEPWRNFEIPRRCLHCYTLNTGRIQTCFLGTIVVFTKVKLLLLSANYKVHSQHSLHLFVQLICNHTARLMSAIEQPLKLQAFWIAKYSTKKSGAERRYRRNSVCCKPCYFPTGSSRWYRGSGPSECPAFRNAFIGRGNLKTAERYIWYIIYIYCLCILYILYI